MRLLLLLAAALAAVPVLAQPGRALTDEQVDKTSPSLVRPERPPASRMDIIMDSMDTRLINQSDRWFDDGEFPMVISLLRLQCDMDTTNYDLWTSLIWMYGNIEDRTKELAAAIEFRELNRTWGEAWYPEAEIYFRRGMRAKAIPLLEQAIILGPVHPNSYRLLGNSWRSLGFPAQAVRVWEAMLKLYPSDERAKAQLDRARKEAAMGPPPKDAKPEAPAAKPAPAQGAPAPGTRGQASPPGSG